MTAPGIKHFAAPNSATPSVLCRWRNIVHAPGVDQCCATAYQATRSQPQTHSCSPLRTPRTIMGSDDAAATPAVPAMRDAASHRSVLPHLQHDARLRTTTERSSGSWARITRYTTNCVRSSDQRVIWDRCCCLDTSKFQTAALNALQRDIRHSTAGSCLS